MSILAAHLNDAGIAIVRDDQLVHREPAVALLEAGELTTGDAAWRAARLRPRQFHSRFLNELSTDPLPDHGFQHLTSADLFSHLLEQVWGQLAGEGDQLALAVPAGVSTAQLGLVLGIALDLGIPVVALADAAVAATRRCYEHAVPLHIDIGLHNVSLSRLAQDDEVSVERAEVIADSGILNLSNLWLRVIAEAFVQQSRFDPLHTAATEQLLQDQLPGWMRQAAAAEAVVAEVEYQGTVHRAEIDPLALVTAAAPVYQAIVSQARTIVRAEETPAIQLSERAAGLPGLADTLKSRVGGEVFLLEPGATARGLLARIGTATAGDGRTLLRRLPWDRPAVSIESQADIAHAGRPTHVLYGHRAFAINGRPLLLGSQAGDGERWLDFEEEMPGLSRRHCVLAVDGQQVVVRDHSRYGTFLNGHRIDGTAVLQVGDVLRVGTPGFDLRLITTEDEHGA